MATVRQIAELSGVSPSTVCRVINGNTPVKESTRNKVLAAIQQLDSSVENNSHPFEGNVGIIMPTSSALNLASHPSLYTAVIGFIETIGSYSIGNTTILLDEQSGVCTPCSNKICGYLILGTNDQQEEKLMSTLSASGVPFVFINRQMGNRQVSCVNIDDAQATSIAVNYLLELGHKKIAFIGGNQDFPNTKLRYSSYIHTLESAGIQPESSYVFFGDYSEQSGKEMADKLLLLKDLPTAACVSSDSIAIGFMHRLSESGIRVPEDMSIIGFGDIEASSYISPALTTIAQNSREMGRVAALVLLQLMKNPCICSQQVLIRTSLVVRDSCSPLSERVLHQNI